MEEKLPIRKQNRLKNYDYSQSGAYFITICTKDRQNLFWKPGHTVTVGEDSILPHDKEVLSAYGKTAEEAILTLPVHYPCIQVLKYVVMPNHIYLVLYIPYEGGRIISSPTSILVAVGQMKRWVSKKIGIPVWQRSFHDHVIRDRADYDKIAEYIDKNPVTWQYDCFYNEK